MELLMLMLMLMLYHVFPQRRQGKEDDLRAENTQTLRQLRQHLGHLFFEPNPSAPSSYLRSARLPSATSALGCTPSTSTSRQLENSLRTSFFHYFNFGDALRKKTSKSRIRTEMLDGLGGCWGNQQGLSYIPKIIRTELTIEKTRCQEMLWRPGVASQLISHNLGGIAYVYRLEGHELRFEPRCCWPAYEDGTFQAGADNRCTRACKSFCRSCSPMPRPFRLDCRQLRLSLHLQVLVPAVPLSGSAAVTRLWAHCTRLLWGRHHPPFQIQVGISWLHAERTFCTDLANPFPPDLWGYVHGFSYWFDLWIGYVWQISLRRTLWGFVHRFGHKLGISSSR